LRADGLYAESQEGIGQATNGQSARHRCGFLPLDSGFGIVKVSDETFAINCAERFDFNELRRDDTIAGNQRERWPRL
jgi:hypothetical protein